MFESAMLDSAASGHTRRGWAMLLSLTAQTAVMAMVLLLPLIAPQSIATPRVSQPIVAPRSQVGLSACRGVGRQLLFHFHLIASGGTRLAPACSNTRPHPGREW